MSQFLDGIEVNEDSETGKIEAPDFDLHLSMDCGQIFGWEEAEGKYTGTLAGRAVTLVQDGANIHYFAETGLNPARISHFLALDVNYRSIMRAISIDDFMKKAVDSAWGLRLLRQEPWPCLGSYILSSNNSVERIRSLVREVSLAMGEARYLGDRRVYAFPRPEALASCHEKDIRACGAGFRSPYLNRAARMVAAGEADLDSLAGLPYAEAKDVLKRLPGVGDKIADCVLLFAFSYHEAFPVDVWIKRAVERIYFDSRELKIREIHEFARSYFGEYAGYAQEYIYYYARECGLE